MISELKSVSGSERLSRFERAARWLFAACVALFALESLLFTDGGLLARANGLLDWPPIYFMGLVVGGVAVSAPYSRIRSIMPVRIGALVALCGVVTWVGGILVLLAVYAAVMSNFD